MSRLIAAVVNTCTVAALPGIGRALLMFVDAAAVAVAPERVPAADGTLHERPVTDGAVSGSDVDASAGLHVSDYNSVAWRLPSSAAFEPYFPTSTTLTMMCRTRSLGYASLWVLRVCLVRLVLLWRRRIRGIWEPGRGTGVGMRIRVFLEAFLSLCDLFEENIEGKASPKVL